MEKACDTQFTIGSNNFLISLAIQRHRKSFMFAKVCRKTEKAAHALSMTPFNC